jgi:hypothetical protein
MVCLAERADNSVTCRGYHLRESTERQRQSMETVLPKVDATAVPEDPLLKKLTEYHRQLSRDADNLVTERLTPEARAVIADIGKIGDDGREKVWSKEDQERLKNINSEVIIYYSNSWRLKIIGAQNGDAACH